MQGMTKYIIGAVVVLILAAAGYLVWSRASSTATPPPPPPAPPAPITHTYASSTFSIVYPDGYTADEAYKYEGVPKKPIGGVKFTIPLTVATGTNLSSDSGVSVESLPRAQRCTGDIYIYENVRAEDYPAGPRTWSMASTSGAAAGNFYEEVVFALKDSKPCLAVRYMIHSTNIGNYPAGAVREFDRAALMASFDKIRDSIRLPGEMPVGTTTSGVTP